MFENISFYPSLYLLFIELPLIGYPITPCNISINRDRRGWPIQLEFLSRKMDKLYPGVEVIAGWDDLLELLEFL